MSLSQTFNQDPNGNIGTAGAVTTASPAYSNGTEASLSLTTAGALRTDGSAVTQPISATSLPLPTGASTAALQTTGNTTLSTISTSATTISGQLPATLGAKAGTASLSVTPASDAVFTIAGPLSATGTLTSVSSSATSVTVLALNLARKGYVVFNDSTQVLYLAFSATSTTSAYSVKLFPNACATSELDYTGIISGIWASANGAAKITEFT